MHNYFLAIGVLLITSSIIFLNYEKEIPLEYGFTDDFTQFIKNYNPFYDFIRLDIPQSTYGGAKIRPTIKPDKYPIIFIHDNSDIGVGNGGKEGWQIGFTKLIKQFQKNGGYTKADLYVTTWGNGDPEQIIQQDHKQTYIMTIRHFILGILEYTKSEKVIIIGHGMGVTLARAAIIGGNYKESMFINFNVGNPISNKIAGFFSLSGANQGLNYCVEQNEFPYCNPYNGLIPKSMLLSQLNLIEHREGDKIYSFWSSNQNIIMNQCLINDINTCIIPGNDKSFYRQEYNHYDVRDKFGSKILNLIQQL